MNLGQLIEKLEKADQNKLVRRGFTHPHSYRGYYDELAFEPKDNVKVSEMLELSRGAVGQTFEGWKGGEYRMSKDTDVWLAFEGECGEGIGNTLLWYMLNT